MATKHKEPLEGQLSEKEEDLPAAVVYTEAAPQQGELVPIDDSNNPLQAFGEGLGLTWPPSPLWRLW